MKRTTLAALAAAVLSVGIFSANVRAEKAAKSDKPAATTEAKTVSGKTGCATCEGVTAKGHSILLTDKDGYRWVLLGDGPAYKKIHEVRKDGKTVTATLSGDPVVKKDSDGKEYKEVKISDIKVDA
ncbi:MAG: hypothetical protein JWO87_1786 [Phycisphaerales bacterium]|jgi:uncharacterized membrane protein|nr:hypothetical protein [Phycisphaerales bacterium]MDB5304013.1 hypothetical protein [Phycisphaerales bacterium]